MKLGGLSLCTIGAGVKGLLVRKKEGSKVFHLKRCRDWNYFFDNRFFNSLDGKAFEGYRCARCPKGQEKRLIIGHG